MANDLVSVVVPIYNVEDYLQRCIRSILEQTHQNLEIIAVDDGSTDDSGKIIDRLAASDGRIRVTHKQNGGVTAARIDGARMARGDWISFVDADDILEPQMYEHLLSNAEKYNADISHCGYQMVFPDGHIDYYYNTGHLAQQDKMALSQNGKFSWIEAMPLFMRRKCGKHPSETGQMSKTIRRVPTWRSLDGGIFG